MENKVLKKPKVYLELMRCIACFLVIVNHTNSGIFLSEEPGSVVWIVSMSYFYMCKIAVPIFLMISGALLLSREEIYRKHLKRIIKVVLGLVFFSMIYYIRICIVEKTTFSLQNFFLQIYNTHITNAFWYFYLYIGLLIFLPLFQKWTLNLKRKDFIYLLFLIFLGGSLRPILVHYNPKWNWSSYFSMVFISVYVGILFLGLFLDNYVMINKKGALICSVFFFVTIFVEVFLTWKEYIKTPEWYLFYDDCTYLPIILSAGCAFYIIKYIGMNISSQWFIGGVIFIGKTTFGIFLLSDLLITIWGNFYGNLCTICHPFIAVIFYEILIFVSGVILTSVMLHIPFVKRLL